MLIQCWKIISKTKMKQFLVFFGFSLVSLSLVLGNRNSSNEIKIKSSSYIFPCYYVYEPHVLKPESIPAFNLCTHIIILGCIVEQENETLARYLTKPYDCSMVLKKLSSLKQINPELKVIMSMGTNVKAMQFIVQNSASIDSYTTSAINLAIEFNFDGIDIDWEYPCGDDRFRFTSLLKSLRAKVNKFGLNLLLSSAIGAGFNTIKECYDLDGLVKYLDYINVMCYDYNTIYNTYTAYASPLFARPDEEGYDATLNSNFTISYLLEQNVPKEKIVLGLNAGGHTFQLADASNYHDFHAPVLGVGFGSGWALYPQLCRLIKTNNGVRVYDEIAEVLYGYYDDQWANTGDVRSAIAKAKWAKKMGLAGVFTWCLNWDDLFDLCEHGETFPIHRAIQRELFN